MDARARVIIVQTLELTTVLHMCEKSELEIEEESEIWIARYNM